MLCLSWFFYRIIDLPYLIIIPNKNDLFSFRCMYVVWMFKSHSYTLPYNHTLWRRIKTLHATRFNSLRMITVIFEMYLLCKWSKWRHFLYKLILYYFCIWFQSVVRQSRCTVKCYSMVHLTVLFIRSYSQIFFISRDL